MNGSEAVICLTDSDEDISYGLFDLLGKVWEAFLL